MVHILFMAPGVVDGGCTSAVERHGHAGWWICWRIMLLKCFFWCRIACVCLRGADSPTVEKGFEGRLDGLSVV